MRVEEAKHHVFQFSNFSSQIQSGFRFYYFSVDVSSRNMTSEEIERMHSWSWIKMGTVRRHTCTFITVYDSYVCVEWMTRKSDHLNFHSKTLPAHGKVASLANFSRRTAHLSFIENFQISVQQGRNNCNSENLSWLRGEARRRSNAHSIWILGKRNV